MSEFQEKLHTEAHKIRLTPQEKSAMRAVLQRAVVSSPVAVPSPYVWHMRWRVPQMVTAGVLMVFVAGGSTAYAAQSALPGDALYSIKIDVAEPVEGALQVTPQAQAAWQATLAERRAEEAETLASKGTLTPDEATEIAANLDQHANAAAAISKQLSATDATTSAALPEELAVTLQAHSVILATLASTTDSAASSATLALAGSVSVQAESVLASDSAAVSVAAASTPASSTPAIAQESAPAALAHRGKHGVLATATSSVHTLAVIAAGTTTPTSVVASATSTAAVSVATPASSAPGALRESAASAIASLTSQITAQQSSLDPQTLSKLQTGLAKAESLMAQGDSANDVSQYLKAMRLALSLETYLKADQQLPASHVLEMLLDTSGDQ